MSQKSKREYLRAIYPRYRKGPIAAKSHILDEFCEICGYNRKYALRLLNGPCPDRPARHCDGPRRKQKRTHGPQVISILTGIWEAAGYPWSTRLKALLPLWMPWVRKRFSLTPKIERQLLSISPRTIDLRLKSRKIQLKKKLYGHSKPATLLKHHIPIKTDSWDVTSQALPK